MVLPAAAASRILVGSAGRLLGAPALEGLLGGLERGGSVDRLLDVGRQLLRLATSVAGQLERLGFGASPTPPAYGRLAGFPYVGRAVRPPMPGLGSGVRRGPSLGRPASRLALLETRADGITGLRRTGRMFGLMGGIRSAQTDARSRMISPGALPPGAGRTETQGSEGFRKPEWMPDVRAKYELDPAKKKTPAGESEGTESTPARAGEKDPDGADGAGSKKPSTGPGSRGTNRYGKGNTLSEGESYRSSFGNADSEKSGEYGRAYTEGETRTMETRSRTYNEASLDLKKGQGRAGVGAQAQANAVRAEYGAGYDTPVAKAGDVEVVGMQNRTGVEATVGAQAEAEAGLTLGKDPSLEIGAGAFVGARVDAEAESRVNLLGGSGSVKGEGSAWAGAEVDAGVKVDEEGLHGEAGAFAGAKVEGTAGGEIGGVGGEASGEAWAGVGARATGTIGLENGKFSLGFEVGAALGVGGSVGTNMTVDVFKMANDVQAFGRNTGRLYQQTVVPGVGRTTRRVGIGARRAANDVNRFGQRTGRTIGRTATHQFTRASRTIGLATRRATRTVDRTTARTKRTVRRTSAQARRTVTRTTTRARSTARKTTRSARRFIKKLF